VPQIEAYANLNQFANIPNSPREVGIILPVGCGKSGCITLTPFAFMAKRALVIAPGLNIADQLDDDFNPTKIDMFYQKCSILSGPPYPEPVRIRGTSTNVADLEEADVVITNIQQLQGGDENRWLSALPSNFFDLIIFDEGHHSVATSWIMLKQQFPNAQIVNYSATPLRADGQLMAGEIIYSYPIFRAIEAGYVKRIKAIQLNPRTLRYVRRDDDQELEVSLEEVRRLGEVDADFRRSIVTSSKTLVTIVDASLRELDRLRTESGDKRLKIIASALNYEHCIQIVEAYRSRGMRADYVHSRVNSADNKIVMQRLDTHELDVIVQVRKLGEGFDHKYLAVAAIFSIFSNLSPFVQFIGRVMRVIEQNAPTHIANRGVVVFHAGANVARQWSDFQDYSEADQEYFDQLLPLEGIDLTDTLDQREIEPQLPLHIESKFEVKEQSDVEVEEIPLIPDDELAAIKLLQERGRITGDIDLTHTVLLQSVPTTKVYERQAKRSALDERIKNTVGRILGARRVNSGGYELNKHHDGRTNFVIMKAAIDRQVNACIGRNSGQRHNFSRRDLDKIESEFDSLVALAIDEVFNE
jgi:superfamily II DNA or RNA helicase